jgi:hypothetical protein
MLIDRVYKHSSRAVSISPPFLLFSSLSLLETRASLHGKNAPKPLAIFFLSLLFPTLPRASFATSWPRPSRGRYRTQKTSVAGLQKLAPETDRDRSASEAGGQDGTHQLRSLVREPREQNQGQRRKGRARGGGVSLPILHRRSRHHLGSSKLVGRTIPPPHQSSLVREPRWQDR